MFIVNYPPNELYGAIGNPKRSEQIREIVQPDTDLARALVPVCAYLGSGDAYMEIFYFPPGFNEAVELSAQPNSFIFQLLGLSLVDGQTAHPGSLHSMESMTVIAQSLVYSPCVFVRISLQQTHPVAASAVPAAASRHAAVFAPIPVDQTKIRYILVQDNAISPKECQDIIESMNISTARSGEVLLDAVNNVTAYDEGIRRVNLMRTSAQKMVNDTLERIIVRHVETFYETTMEFWNTPVLLKYDEGDFFIPHVDSESFRDGAWLRIYDRDYTLVLFLNEDYEGGELSFPDYDYAVSPKQGRLVVFPGDHTYRHGANETRNGSRYQLVSWLTAYGTPRTRTPPNPDVLFRRW